MGDLVDALALGLFGITAEPHFMFPFAVSVPTYISWFTAVLRGSTVCMITSAFWLNRLHCLLVVNILSVLWKLGSRLRFITHVIDM